MVRYILVCIFSIIFSQIALANDFEIMDGKSLPFRIIPRDQSVSKDKVSSSGYPSYRSSIKNRLYIDVTNVDNLEVSLSDGRTIYKGSAGSSPYYILLDLPEFEFGTPVRLHIRLIMADGSVVKYSSTCVPVEHAGLVSTLKFTGFDTRFTSYLADKSYAVYVEYDGTLYKNGDVWDVESFGVYSVDKYDYLYCEGGMFVAELAQPLSLSRDIPEAWNNEDGNCYSYILNKREGRLFPGYSQGKENSDLTLLQKIQLDLPEMRETTIYEEVPEGYCKIAVVEAKTIYDDSIDYHFYVLKEDGTWWHKPGITEPINTDYVGQLIYDPRVAVRCSSVFFSYDDFLGFYHIYSR